MADAAGSGGAEGTGGTGGAAGGAVAGGGGSARGAGRAAVVVASTRAASGVYADEAGPVLVAGLEAMGFEVGRARVVPDGDDVGTAVREALAAGADVVLTTGGTGLAPTDVTPEQTRPLLEREVPGLAEALRARGSALGVPTSVLSRGLAGTVGRALVVNVAGSPGACRDAVEVLAPVLVHAVSQARGGDHPRPDAGHSGDDGHVGGER